MEYIIDYIEFAIVKELLSVSQTLITAMLNLAQQNSTPVYDLSDTCQWCLFNIHNYNYNYNLGSNINAQWRELLNTCIIQPIQTNPYFKGKFSVSIGELCAPVLPELMKREQPDKDIVTTFYSFVDFINNSQFVSRAQPNQF